MSKTVLTPVTDVDAARAVWSALLGAPTSDSPYYIGWTPEGQEIGRLSHRRTGQDVIRTGRPGDQIG